MQLQTIRTALGQLQSDPEEPRAWQSLDDAITFENGDLDESLRLLSAARQEHLKRREWDAVARLLQTEVRLSTGSERELERLRLEAKVLRDNLLDEGRACRLFERILELDPRDRDAAVALEESRGKRNSWQQLVDTYQAEADKAADDVYRSSMSMRAAEVELRFAADQVDRRRVLDRLTRALKLDAHNERAAEMLELLQRREGNYAAVAEVLEVLLDGAESLATRIAAGVRAARVCRHRLQDDARAARFYRKILELVPNHPEALSFLAEHYTREERWDDLVDVYEASLAVGDPSGRDRVGDILQVGLLLWKKRQDPASAEPWFARIRKLDPANQGMLEFYRAFYASDEAAPQLLNILSAAQRVLPSGKDKQAITAEIAHLAAGHKDAQKAVEQYKNLLRQDPANEQAVSALRQLYRKTQNYIALVELLRQRLEGLAADQTEERLGVLREVAALYRAELASDTALVSVLNQISQLDPNDVQVARELVGLYEKLGRWRDLLTSQQRLAMLTQDDAEKIELMRAAGRRWLDQFSNVQNATQAFEALLEVSPGDREASDRLKELYKKRRAWPALYKLYEAELPRSSGAERQELLQEMARLASERLGRGEDATSIYRKILEGEPQNSSALAALEKQAERSKDWATLADALERRAEQTDGAQQKMAVLQKLGGVYSEHLHDAAAAARTFLRVLELSPGHARALRVLRDGYLESGDYDGLEKLYASQHDWEGLAEVLGGAADRVEDPRVKVELSYRAARVYDQRLAQPERAFRCYERILAADPTDLRAAQALIPIYEKEEKWARLPALYELCLAAESAPAAKRALLEKLIQLTGTRLVDRGRALSYARAAFELAPERPETLAQLDDASRAARDYGPFVEAVGAQLSLLQGALEDEPASEIDSGGRQKRRRGGRKSKRQRQEEEREAAAAVEAASTLSGSVRRLEMKLAQVYDEHLSRSDLAAASLRGLLQRDPSDAEAAEVLERLLRREGKQDELRELFEIKLNQVPAAEGRIRLLSDWANLEQTEFDSKDRAADLYRRILEIEPGRLSAVRALPQLLLALQKPEEAAAAIEAQSVHVEGAARADLEVQLSELYLEDLNRPESALDAAARTLQFAPGDARAMAVLRRLVDIPQTRRRAASVLAESYSQSHDARREAESLEAALTGVTDAKERREMLVRLASVHETKLESHGAALDVMLKALREFSDDLTLWDRAERLATASGRVTELAHALRDTLRSELAEDIEVELCDRAARLHEDTLGDPLGAAPYLERLLVKDAANPDAFSRLKQILTSAERWGELEDLYDRTTRFIDDIPTRVDLLTEVALVCEEIIEDDGRAIGYYERILAIAPAHDASMRALDRLYQRAKRYTAWAELLERRLGEMTGDEALDTELRLARVQLDQLHEPGKAIEHVERVLGERPNDYTARELAERILQIGSFRVRAARALEPVYEGRDEVRELVSVLEVRWGAADEAADEAEVRQELLRRIAGLKDERLHDDVGALEAYARYVPQDPLDVAARERFVEIGLRRGEYARVAAVLEAAATAAEALSLRGEILMLAARVYHEQLADLQRAEAIYRRVLELDPEDAALTLPPARALERLYQANHQHVELAEILRIEIRLESVPEMRIALLGRLGELAEKQLRDMPGAIQAFQRRLEELPEDPIALEALDRLYDASENWRDLVGVLERRREARASAEDRQSLLRRQASVLADKLSDSAGSIEVWRSYRAEFGDSDEALRALEKLYRGAEQWEDLADTYEAHLENTSDSTEKLRMLTALGDLRRDELGLPQPALDAYREALELDFSYRPARLALERLLESKDALTQREAAEVLEPVFETEGDHQRLLTVIEIQTESVEDPIKKLALLQKSADIAENVLSNPERTLMYVTRAVREGAGHADLSGWLERLERVVGQTSRRAEQVALLREIVVNIFEGQLQFDVTQRIAELARDHLRDPELAREYFEKALELRLDAQAPMRALEAIYEEAGDLPNLLGILERRADVTADETERRKLLLRHAELLRDRLRDREAATLAFERIIEFEPDPRAAEALEGLYADAGRWEDLIELYQRQLDVSPSAYTELRVKIARVAARELRDLPRAFEALDAALTSDRHNLAAMSELEYLMDHSERSEHRAHAAALLEPIYSASGNFERVMATLASRLEYSQDPDERRELLTRLAKLHEEQKEDYGAALATIAKLLDEDVTDQDTVRELERLARVADSGAELARIYASALERVSVDEPATAKLAQRTGQLFAEHGELERSLSFYRRALDFDPEDRQVFDELDDLLARAGKHEERVALFTSALESRYEDAERLTLLHQSAELYRGPLVRPESAIDAYRAALEIDPMDAVSLDALSEVYRELERFQELGELYLKRAEATASPTEASVYRLQLARLRAAELADSEGAVDQLEEIVQALPTHAGALDELEKLRKQGVARERVVGILLPLYEAVDDWRRLIKINEDRFALAESVGQKVAVLRETAELWERRGEDLDRARRGLAVAFELDPEDSDLRRDYERLVEATEAWDELCGVYQERLQKVEDLGNRHELLATLARVHDEKRNDPRRALAAYEQLVEEDPSDLDALEKLEQLATMLSDWDVLVRGLRIKAELVDDSEERASLWRQIGETRRDMLDQPDLAIEAYERAAEIEPHSTFTLDSLIGLYQERQDVPRLIELYQRRVELAEEDEVELKFELLCAAGSLYESQQNDAVNAIDMFNQALAVKPSDKQVLGRVNRLYLTAEMWPELLENLRFCVSIAENDQERASLRTRIAQVLAERLGEYDEALQNYRDVLEAAPGEQSARDAVRKIGEDHAEFRELAASILVPALAALERHEDLVQAFEMRLSAQTDPHDRAQTLRQMASVQEERLHNPSAAQAALLRALGDQPDSAELHTEIERLARLSGGFKDYAKALHERAQATFDADLARLLYAALGRISEQELDDLNGAVQAYEEAVRQAGDQPDLLASLDRLYGKLGNYEPLVEILERRASVADTEYEQAELCYRMAKIQLEQFHDSSRCLLSLRRALEYSPGHAGAIRELEGLLDDSEFFEEVSEVLESVYRTLNDTTKLAALFERRIGLAATPEERLEARRTLARVLEDEVGDTAAAQRILQQGVLEEPGNLAVLEELARLAGITGEWTAAAETLEEALHKVVSSEPATAKEIALTLANWRRERLHDGAGAERALGVALECAPDSDDILQQLEELQTAPGREQALIETLRRRGKLAADDQREELFRRAKRLADGLRVAGLSETVLRDLLRLDESNDWALSSLADSMEEAQQYAEALSLLERRIRQGTADDSRELRHRAALLARERLGNLAKASELYLELVEEDPSDSRAADALRVLLVRTERWEDLAGLLESLIDVAQNAEDRLSLRLELAQLYVDRFDQSDTAIEQLRAVLEEEPGHADAVLTLGRLYEKNGRDQDLAELLSQQVDAAQGRGDVAAAVKLLVRLGGVFEAKLAEPERAMDAFRRVLDLDARHRPSIEALVRLYRQADRLEEAAEVLERLLEVSEPSELVRRAEELADLYVKLDQGENACRALERVLDSGQSNPELLARLKGLYEQHGSWNRLAELLVREADGTPNSDEKAKLLSRAATLYAERLEESRTAASLLQRATELRPDDRALLLQLCDVLNASGRSREAAEALQRIVDSYGGRRSKELGEIHRRLAAAYRAQGNNADALRELDQAFRIEPGNVGVLKELGELAFELDDLKKAQQMYRALLLQRLDSESPITKAEVFFALGRVHDALGERPKARQMLERALQTDANLEGAKRFLADLAE